MDCIITIDRGNTALKAALWTAQGKLMGVDSSLGRKSAGVSTLVDSLVKATGAGRVKAIGYSSVVPQAKEADLQTLSSYAPVVDVSARIPLPFDISYRTPDTLGADRICAVAGAMELVPQGNILVADLGTAVTVDCLLRGSKPGEKPIYAGGNISAGVKMRLQALHGYTSALPEVDADQVPEDIFGKDTDQAMLCGAVHGVVAELEYYRSKLKSATVVLTGGGAQYLTNNDLVTFPSVHDPFLVHRGLKNIVNLQ